MTYTDDYEKTDIAKSNNLSQGRRVDSQPRSFNDVQERIFRFSNVQELGGVVVDSGSVVSIKSKS